MRTKVLLGSLALALVFAAPGLAVTKTTDPGLNWLGYMHVFETPANGGAWQWGSAWGTADLPAIYDADILTIGPNTNTYNIEDAYWTNPDGSGNKFMEANFYVEDASLLGQTLDFTGEALEYTYVEGYETRAFIKVLDPNNGWSVVDEAFVGLVDGETFTVSLDIPATAGLVPQYGFVTTGINADPATVEALGHAVIGPIPEPASLALLALGGVAVLRRR